MKPTVPAAYYSRMLQFIPWRVVLHAGGIAGTLIVLFALLKDSLFLSGTHPDLFLTIVGACFLSAGYLLKRSRVPMPSSPVMSTVQDRLQILSRRERIVLAELLGELPNKEIADKLCIGVSTLKTHINNIYRKTGVSSRRELVGLLAHTSSVNPSLPG
jgi:DNA-binding CsgD family transcriptional regulator